MLRKHGTGHLTFWLCQQTVVARWRGALGVAEGGVRGDIIKQTRKVQAYVRNMEKRRGNRYEGKDKASWPSELESSFSYTFQGLSSLFSLSSQVD